MKTKSITLERNVKEQEINKQKQILANNRSQKLLNALGPSLLSVLFFSLLLYASAQSNNLYFRELFTCGIIVTLLLIIKNSNSIKK